MTIKTSSVESQQDGNQPSHELESLSFFEKLGFAFGHVFNDLVAGVWYSYVLLFLEGVQQFSGPQAGAILMLGQVADAISTPIVGILTDKFGTKRKWHIFGTLGVLMTFPPLFSICPFCEDFTAWWKFSYYAIIILIFQFAWPVVQISHMGMIPEISRTERERSDLTAMIYSAMIISVLTLFGVTWAVIHAEEDNGDNKITPSDGTKFRVSQTINAEM